MNTTRSSLLDKVRDFDHASAWVEFDRLYRPLLVRYARHWGLSDGEGEEIAQQCLDVVLGQIREFRRKSSFRGWLRGIAHNKVRQHFRDKHKRAGGGDDALAEVADPAEAPPEVWDRQWEAAHVAYCIDHLGDDFAAHTLQAFELYVVHEMPVEEISRLLGMTPNQIYVAKSRVMKKLRERSAELMRLLYGEDA